MDGIEAVGLPERVRRHVLIGLPPRHPGGQLYPGVVGDELQAVLIAGDDDALPVRRLAPAADSADQVVGLVARQLVPGDGHGVQHVLHGLELHGQLLVHGLALGLVRRVRLVAERGLAAVKGDAQGVGLLLVHQPLHGGQKAKDGVGVQPLTGCQRPNTVVGAVDEAVAVQYHKFHKSASCFSKSHNRYIIRRFPP